VAAHPSAAAGALALVVSLALASAAPPACSAAPIDAATTARILALDPDRLSERDVHETLAAAPAPRIILLQGSLAFVTMAPFAEFLVAMGYPEERLRNPRDGALSYGSDGSSAALAGELAWYYENERMMPLLIGHSQGGMLAIRTLHELAGTFGDAIAVVDPRTGEALARTTIVDPRTGRERPVVGLEVPYAAALATGKLPRLLLGQWSMLPLLRRIPDSAVEFTGFSFAFDPIAGEFGGADPYRPTGSATVRNVTLPASDTHIGLPDARHLAADPAARAWIDAYVPGSAAPLPPAADTRNIVHAADIWHSVRKAWCRAAQQLLRDRADGAAP
jgi:hypothetical protein